MKSEKQAMASVSFCGHDVLSVLGAHGGMLLCAASALVELKMANEADSMERMMREQLKPTPRSANLAMRTRVLIFCRGGQPFRPVIVRM